MTKQNFKLKSCIVCSTEFKQFKSTVKVCSISCAIKHAKIKTKQVKKNEWNKEKKKRKEFLKTRSDHLNELQVIFNRWIRLRDSGNNCISCGKKAKKENAGHYRSVGSCPELRFEPLNVHLQCEYCNTFLHANLINYRINLINLIGVDKVEWLEGKHEPKKYTVQEIKELKQFYKDKIRNI